MLVGEVGIFTRRNPDRVRGADVLFISNEQCARWSNKSGFLDVAPELVVEILSPNDTVQEIAAKLKLYRQCGVPIVWIIDTDLCTVTEHRPGRHPKLFTQADTITGEPHLPGFSCAVAEFFG